MGWEKRSELKTNFIRYLLTVRKTDSEKEKLTT